jgi:hypothetical protein
MARMLTSIDLGADPARKLRKNRWVPYVVAAVVLLAIVGGTVKTCTRQRHELGTEGRLADEISLAGAKVTAIQTVGQSVQVAFTIQDNLTANLVRDGAKLDVLDILKAVQASGYSYDEIAIRATTSLTDVYGNTREGEVLRVSYNRATVDRINWSGFLSSNVFDIADSLWLHPAF